MNFWQIIGIALALSADAFCAAISVGAGKQFRGQTFRLAFHFGLFQAMMPALGWALGSQVVDYVRAWDHWLAGGIVSAVALRMLWEAFRRPEESQRLDASRGWSLVSLSVATSVDALAMGLVFAVIGISILVPCVTIGLVAGIATCLGLYFGRRLRASFGRWVEVAGALLLLAVAIHLFFTV